MDNVINFKREVERILGYAMDDAQYRTFRELRAIGYANPVDIARHLA